MLGGLAHTASALIIGEERWILTDGETIFRQCDEWAISFRDKPVPISPVNIEQHTVELAELASNLARHAEICVVQRLWKKSVVADEYITARRDCGLLDRILKHRRIAHRCSDYEFAVPEIRRPSGQSQPNVSAVMFPENVIE
jgi:hypothetical protein